MTAFSERHVADLRLAVLQVLAAAGLETNVPILRASVEEATMHRPAASLVRQELAWLDERGLVTRRAIGASVAAATITERGEDVALGRERIAGVAAPETG